MARMNRNRPNDEPHPVSNILSNWMVERARYRNARADRLIEEIDGHLANPTVVNRYIYGPDNPLRAVVQRADGSYESAPGFYGFHRGTARDIRNWIVENGLRPDLISELRRYAMMPVNAVDAQPAAEEAAQPVAEADIQYPPVVYDPTSDPEDDDDDYDPDLERLTWQMHQSTGHFDIIYTSSL